MSFHLKERINLPDINSIGFLYEHDKTKARVAYVQNEEKNKTFSISFMTIPYDDNGIAHILEHSVLCGSKKYPTKEPFVELAKGSLNTFLNAMTFSDKTMYPVSSENDKDFTNLMDVYLDAVFFPRLIDNPYILKQEGWHYHLEKPEDDLIYKGVVYNEMKGAFSDPEQVIYREIDARLFPDTLCQHESGGHPLSIPTLTQDAFVDFHSTYYHPSNSYTFLYGAMDIEEKLAHLDTYFNQFDYKDIVKPFIDQKPFESIKEEIISYSIEEDETEENKTFLSMNFAIGQSADSKMYLQMTILSDILLGALGSNAAPLKKALLQSGITSDVSSWYAAPSHLSNLSILLKNSDIKHADTFKRIVFDTLNDIVENGLEQKLVTAAINKARFMLLEGNVEGAAAKGVVRAINAMESWLYNDNPFSYFAFTKDLDDIEKNPKILIDLVRKYLLNNTHILMLHAIPQKNLNKQTFEKVHQDLQLYKNSLTKDDIDTLVKETQTLLHIQQTDDTKEDLEKLPLLSLEDLNETASDYPLIVDKQDTVTYLTYKTFTGNIDYFNFFFDISHIQHSDYTYVGLIVRLLEHLGTSNYSVEALSTEIDSYTGGVSFNTSAYTKGDVSIPILTVSGKAFSEYTPTLLTLLKDILLHTQFTDRQKLKEELLKIKSRIESNQFFGTSHVVAFNRLTSYYSSKAAYGQFTGGIDFYRFIADILEDFDEQASTLIQNLQRVYAQLFNQHKLTIGYTGASTSIQDTIKPFLTNLPNTPLESVPFIEPFGILNEGFALSQDVQYVGQGYNVALDGLSFTGHLLVLKTLLSFTYLWNTVRVQGGAYGAFTILDKEGSFLFMSYRDPNVLKTIQAYEKAPEFIETLALDNRELTKYIIGTIGSLDTPLSENEKGLVAFNRYLKNITLEDVQKERSQVLHTTIEDLRQLATYVEKAMSHKARCVVGSKQSLEENKELFDSIIPLIK
ncbi:peptidase M16 [Granulicatella sp. zg-ZJ]|uniref:insulinase family protein n=1 Tax=Granulicatella sp. zg-ZJ TaxID=2678504 RepID=UPI0013D3FB3B|nr:insulinase family protein [Granulicatella sp. zg-ZJ]NEW63087.1 peptidase M16 [Granulicatella sp. zg-ZJ]